MPGDNVQLFRVCVNNHGETLTRSGAGNIKDVFSLWISEAFFIDVSDDNYLVFEPFEFPSGCATHIAGLTVRRKVDVIQFRFLIQQGGGLTFHRQNGDILWTITAVQIVLQHGADCSNGIIFGKNDGGAVAFDFMLVIPFFQVIIDDAVCTAGDFYGVAAVDGKNKPAFGITNPGQRLLSDGIDISYAVGVYDKVPD